MKRFAKKLQTLRINVGLSQRQLAEILGIDHRHIGRLENGERLPGTELTLKIADYFNISLDQLMRDEVDL